MAATALMFEAPAKEAISVTPRSRYRNHPGSRRLSGHPSSDSPYPRSSSANIPESVVPSALASRSA
jgi:hypothetical protein